MDILVIGGGGREHAIIKKLKENPSVGTIFALPGNGGIAADAVCLGGSPTDIPGIVAAAREHGADFVVVAPDDPWPWGRRTPWRRRGSPASGPGKAPPPLRAARPSPRI